jgi:hypothetical protein
MLRLRYLATYFRFWFGAIWAALGTVFLVIWFAAARREVERVAWTAGFGGGLLATALGGVLVASAIRASGRRVALLQSGTRATGTVAGVGYLENLRVNGRNPVFLRVDYKDELGRAHQVASACLPSALRERWAPGDPIGVVYDAFDPTRGEVDIFGTRPA